MRRRAAALVGFGFFTATGLLFFSYRYLDDLARERTGTFGERLIEEMTGAYAAALLFPLVLRVARRFPFGRRVWLRRLPVHLATLLLFSVLHTTLNWLSRDLVFRLCGLGPYDYGIMPIRYLMEFANDAIVYSLFVALIHLFDYYRESRDQEVRTALLEARLTQAQLQALRLQLQPHFLFNALNTISAVIYEDAGRADRMIARLSDLLRLALRNSTAQEVTLQEELEFLELYLELMRARFEERLVVKFEVEPETTSALVPQLILQPLVENSIRHAASPSSGTLSIDVSARRSNGALLLEVSDNGPGIRKEQQAIALGDGIGLSNTSERLNQLYGAEHRFSLGASSEGGLLVHVEVPFHTRRSSETDGAKGGD
ncbi:MAG TPA: histidine kinase [Pyrinomonadaceae bacterium]|jgi:signal transduction histidine kinase|nr:histidine kinase [Pyrinomonadaceae bacterium]